MEDRTIALTRQLLSIWEGSVRLTHTFLSESAIVLSSTSMIIIVYILYTANFDFANSNLTLFTSNTKPEPRVKEDSGHAERHHDGTDADRL